MTSAHVYLPPLPAPRDFGYRDDNGTWVQQLAYESDHMGAYATAAVLADRAARPDAKPVAWMTVDGREACTDSDKSAWAQQQEMVSIAAEHSVPLYAAPPADAKDAARLTDERILALWEEATRAEAQASHYGTGRDHERLVVCMFARAIEAAMLETQTKEAT